MYVDTHCHLEMVEGELPLAMVERAHDAGVDAISGPASAGSARTTRTRLSASVDYAKSGDVVQRNTINPFLSIAQLSSQANFQKQFDWGTVNLGGSRSHRG